MSKPTVSKTTPDPAAHTINAVHPDRDSRGGRPDVAYVSAGTEPGAVMTVHYDDGTLAHWQGVGS